MAKEEALLPAWMSTRDSAAAVVAQIQQEPHCTGGGGWVRWVGGWVGGWVWWRAEQKTPAGSMLVSPSQLAQLMWAALTAPWSPTGVTLPLARQSTDAGSAAAAAAPAVAPPALGALQQVRVRRVCGWVRCLWVDGGVCDVCRVWVTPLHGAHQTRAGSATTDP